MLAPNRTTAPLHLPDYNLPGYDYLHREVPFYDALTGRGFGQERFVAARQKSADPGQAGPCPACRTRRVGKPQGKRLAALRALSQET